MAPPRRAQRFGQLLAGLKIETTWRAAAASIAVIGIATALGPNAAAATGVASSSCLPQGAKMIAEDDAGAVYSSGHAVFACSVDTGRSTELGSSAGAGPGAASVGAIALAGPYVVYATHTMGVDTGSSGVFLRRLSTGTVISMASAFPTMLGPESITTIDAVVALPSGAYAWTVSGGSIIRAGSFNVGVYEAGVQSGTARIKLLDQGRRIAPKSLKLSGTQLTWKHGSINRHAKLG